MLQSSRLMGSALIIFIALVPCLQAQDDKVHRALTPAAMEKLLQGLKIEFKKLTPPKGDEVFYEFTRDNYKIRLTVVSPKELMLDCVFRGIPLNRVNEWNTITRVARVSLHQTNGGAITLLEYGLDLGGGFTDGTLKQFITRFDEELKLYDKFIGKVVDDKILTKVTDDNLETILKSLALKYEKKTNAAGVTMFDFQMKDHKLRLYNFGGLDLMMDAHFRKISLADANRYNLNKKFIRVVNYKAKDTEYTSLEINFDCEAGVTEGMIRHWIASYGSDVQDFAEYAKKLHAEEKK